MLCSHIGNTARDLCRSRCVTRLCGESSSRYVYVLPMGEQCKGREGVSRLRRSTSRTATVRLSTMAGPGLSRNATEEPLARLTPREHEVLALMAEGRSNVAIAQQLVIGEGAVGQHIANILAKSTCRRPTATTAGYVQ